MSPAKRRAEYGTGTKPARRADGLWVARIEAGWTAHGTRRRITVSAKTEAECRRKLKERKRELAAGKTVGLNVRETVKSWSETWLPRHAKKVRPTTYTTDAGTMRKWIIPTLGHRRLTELNPGDLRKLEETIRAAGRSSTTALHAHTILLVMLKAAIVEGHNIAPGVMLAPKPGKAANDRGAIPLDQALAILAVAGQRDDAARWVVGMLLGLRSGEARGLTWDRVDLDNGTIDVRWQLQHLAADHTIPDGWEEIHLAGHAWLTRPKTSAGKRSIPLVAGTVASLRAARELWTPNPWGLVWTDSNGEPIHKAKDLAAFHAIQAEAGARHPSGRPWNVHEMRHTAISLLVALGVDRTYIAKVVGQVKLIDSYVTPDDVRIREMLERAAATLQIGS